MFQNFWFKAIPSFFTTKTLKVMWLSCFLVGLYTFFILYIEEQILHIDFKPNPTIFSLMGLVLGLLLVFRTNTAYDRWWEGRRMLGMLNDQVRNMAMKLHAFLPKDDHDNRIFFAEMIGNYGIAMKEHLRAGVKFEELELNELHLEQLKRVKHVPNKISSLLIDQANTLYLEKKFTNEQFLLLNKQFDSFAEVVGACERIRTTPIPASYSIHLKKFLFFYILILPYGLIHDLRYWSIFIMVLIFYAFAGLEVIGEEIEDPFGKDINDLPMDTISYKIRGSVKEILL